MGFKNLFQIYSICVQPKKFIQESKKKSHYPFKANTAIEIIKRPFENDFHISKALEPQCCSISSLSREPLSVDGEIKIIHDIMII